MQDFLNKEFQKKEDAEAQLSLFQGLGDSGLGTRRLGHSDTRRRADSHIGSEMGLFFFTKILMYQMIQFQKGTR